LIVGVGILAVFVGVAMLAPIISVPVIRVLAGWYPSVFGTVGRLARENALRNPRRTAATASALMIGMALVAAISIIGASANESVRRPAAPGCLRDVGSGRAGLDELAIRLLEPSRGAHLAVLVEHAALLVADPVERGDDLGEEAARLGQDPAHGVGVEVLEP